MGLVGVVREGGWWLLLLLLRRCRVGWSRDVRVDVVALVMMRRWLWLIVQCVGFRGLCLVRWMVGRLSRREQVMWMEGGDRRGQVWNLGRLSQRVRLPAKPSLGELRLRTKLRRFFRRGLCLVCCGR